MGYVAIQVALPLASSCYTAHRHPLPAHIDCTAPPTYSLVLLLLLLLLAGVHWPLPDAPPRTTPWHALALSLIHI
eukprot:5072747-Prymnesium_polylepis.2